MSSNLDIGSVRGPEEFKEGPQFKADIKAGADGGSGGFDINQARELFYRMYPVNAPNAFDEAYALYVKDQTDTHGSFVLDEKTFKLFLLEHNSLIHAFLDTTYLREIGASSTEVLNRILKLLTLLLTVMQGIAMAQSQRLAKSTELQNIYTDQLASLPVFVKGDGTPLGEDTEEARSARSDMNDKINSNIRAILEGKRQKETDTGKLFMTNLNQTSDMVSNLASMFTSIVQEITSICGAIVRR